MKIGYKATDSNMMCRKQQYELGSEYYITKSRKCVKNFCLLPTDLKEDNSLRLCGSDVIHYCESLEDCFRWYDVNTSRFFKVEIKGKFKNDVDKSGTTRLKIIEEVSKKEIGIILKKRKIEQEDKRLKLDKLRVLQTQFPNLILGGSLGLYLQGAKLKRLENGIGDFDLIHPFWINLQEVEGVNHIDAKNSGNTFDETFNFEGTKLDLAIDNECKYNIVEYNGYKYKLSVVENIIKYKSMYATQKNGKKHRDDLYELLGLKQ